MRLDKDAIIKASDPYITDILDKLNIEWRDEPPWIAIQCIFHGGTKFNLKYRNLKFYCFSECNRCYSIIDVVMKQLDLDFVSSMRWICSEIGLSDCDVSYTKDVVKIRENLNYMKQLARKRNKPKYTQVDQLILNDITPCAHPYLLKQGFKKETLEYFGVGYAMFGELEDRVCFPIDAPDGTIISVSGRAIGMQDPKYYIVGETNKASTLYNYSRAKDEVLKYGYIVLVEGFKSVMKLYEWGYTNSVACMGSSVSDKQVKLLLRLGVKIAVCGDNDKAGKLLNQKVYNLCYKFAEVIKLPMSKYTDVEKDSIADLDEDAMFELIDDLDAINR